MSEKYYHLHLISDSTGETINVVAKAVCARFVGATAIEHVYGLVRGKKQLTRAIASIEENPGPVMFSIIDSTFEHRGKIGLAVRSPNHLWISLISSF